MNDFNYGFQYPYQNMQNCYTPPMQRNYIQPSIQQAQQTQNTNFKLVDSIEVVKAMDIPMDGNPYYFPKADETEIFSKKWLPNGTTQILTYKAVLNNQTDNLPQNELESRFAMDKSLVDGIIERLDELSDKIDKINKPQRAKKEVTTNE